MVPAVHPKDMSGTFIREGRQELTFHCTDWQSGEKRVKPSLDSCLTSERCFQRLILSSPPAGYI